MKKIKTLFYYFVLFLSLTSCSSDDDSSNGENQFTNDIVGVWSPVGFCNLNYTFYSDGTFEYDSYSWDYSGRYIINGTNLEIIAEEEDESMRATIEKITSDEMIWSDVSGEETRFISEEACQND